MRKFNELTLEETQELGRAIDIEIRCLRLHDRPLPNFTDEDSILEYARENNLINY